MAREFIYIDEEKTAIKTGDDGMPMFRDTIINNGKEEVVETQANVFHLLDKVPALGNDLKNERLERKKLQDLFASFESKDIKFESSEDVSKFIDKALDSISKVDSFDKKDFVAADKIEELKAGLNRTWEERMENTKQTYEEQLQTQRSQNEQSQNQIRKLMINDRFSSSKFVDEKCSAPAKVLSNCFASNFEVDLEDISNPKVIAKDDKGEIIYSKMRAGELPDFDEALSILVETSPDKNFFLKGSGKGGTGQGSGGPGSELDFNAQHKNAMDTRDIPGAISLKLKKYK